MPNNLHFLFLLVFTSSFTLGLYTGTYKTFPFEQILIIKKFFLGERLPRFTDLTNRKKSNVNVGSLTGIFITYGQSNAANSGQYGYHVSQKVFQYFDNNIYSYEDPALGGSGLSGSVWGMTGDKLILNGLFDQVVFSVTGVGGSNIEQLNKGTRYKYFKNEYFNLLNKFGRVDGILFHQGESDHREYNDVNYLNKFNDFLAQLSRDGIQTNFYLSRASYCRNWVDQDLINSQNKIIFENAMVLEGPNTDTLIQDEYRLPDRCHFSLKGLDKFSQMWVESISASSSASREKR